jgi:DNA-binding NtrC family response regulator
MKGTLREWRAIPPEEDLREGETKVNPVWKNAEFTEPNIEKYGMILIVSACLDHRSTLARIFEGLNLEVVICSSLAQATDFLAHQTTDLIFCDENLPDGTYRDLLAQKLPGRKNPPVVVAVKESNWERSLEAIWRGAFDVIRRPCTPNDVELVLIHAVRAENPGAAYHSAADCS